LLQFASDSYRMTIRAIGLRGRFLTNAGNLFVGNKACLSCNKDCFTPTLYASASVRNDETRAKFTMTTHPSVFARAAPHQRR
jgi:hypothetical protein